MEVKGIGIVNLRMMYGVGAVRSAGDLSLVVALEPEDPARDFSLEPDSVEILGMHLPKITIPSTGAVFEAGRGTILDAALRAGVILPHECRSGTCKCRLVSGAAKMDPWTPPP